MDKLLTILLPIMAPMLQALMAPVSESLRDMLKNFILNFYAQAKTTPNGWDDIAAGALCILFSIPTPTN